MDEPTTYLDLAHQLEVLDLLVRLNEEGKSIIMVLHDLNHAAQYADHLVVLAGGRIVAQGHAHAVITEEIVRDVFQVQSKVIPHPVTGPCACRCKEIAAEGWIKLRRETICPEACYAAGGTGTTSRIRVPVPGAE